MVVVRETPSPLSVRHLVTGDFVQQAGYRVIRSRGTDTWLLIYTRSGRGRFGLAGGEFVVSDSDLVLISPGVPHDYGVEESLQRWALLWTHFHPRAHWHDLMRWPEVGPGGFHLRLDDKQIRHTVVDCLTLAHRLATGALRRREWFALNALEEMLLWCDVVNPRSGQAELDPRVREVMDYMCRELTSKLTLAHVADVAGLSVSRLAHLFRQQVGTTPQQFLELQRLNRAKQLLEFTPLSIKEIAAAVGFDTQFYFTLRFTKHTGMSPSQYRKQPNQQPRKSAR
jgi:AraC family transcriptional regulator, arabinose operon regulatory protein